MCGMVTLWGSVIYFHIQKSMFFKIIAKNLISAFYALQLFLLFLFLLFSYLIPWNGTFSHGEDCHRLFLGCIGSDLALIETEIFGKLVVENSVTTGGHYCKGKEAMSLVSEVLMFEQFKANQDSTSC